MINRWLCFFDEGGYEEAVWLIILQVLAGALILSYAVWRYTSDGICTQLAFTLFLFGNSALFTAIWVRQYGLFVLCYALLIAVSGELTRRRVPLLQTLMLICGLALSCLAGMMTQYTFATMSLPVHLMLLAVLISRRAGRQVIFVLTSYAVAGLVFMWLLPGAVDHAKSVSAGQRIQLQWMDAVTGLPRMFIPMPSALPGPFRVCSSVAFHCSCLSC